jgi:hypothetical protein
MKRPSEWKRAHLLAVPKGKPEFNVILLDQGEAIEGYYLDLLRRSPLPLTLN